jgi:hypothetical protein
MNDFFDDYMMNYDSLRFYLKEHHRISNEELVLFLEDPEEADKLNKTFEQTHKELGVIIVKVLKDLYRIINLLNHIDLYKEEYEKIKDNEDYYTADFPEFDTDFQDKLRKYGMLKYLNYYQERYDDLFLHTLGENKNKINIEEALL